MVVTRRRSLVQRIIQEALDVVREEADDGAGDERRHEDLGGEFEEAGDVHR